MDTSQLAHPKVDPSRPNRKRDWRSADRRGSAEVRKRSGGRCEVTEIIGHDQRMGRDLLGSCFRRAVHVHHMIGGRGKRGVGISALAIHKQHVCDQCHEDITGGVGGKKLLRAGGQVPLWTDTYRRVR